MARTIIEFKGIEDFKKGLSDFQLEQYPFAMKSALNDISLLVQKFEKARMTADFDRPTLFTINALNVTYATKNNLYSRVYFKDPTRLSENQHYLYPNTYGVKRGFKKFEASLYAKGLMPAGYYAVPGKGVELDQYGNVPATVQMQILSWFQANARSGYNGNTSDATKIKRKKGTRKKYGFEYFSIKKSKTKILPGIYKRTFTPFGVSTSSMFIFVSKENSGYQKVYKFHDEARDVFNQYFIISFDEQLKIAMRTAFV